MPGSLEQCAQQPTNVVVVVHDEDPRGGHRISFHRGIRLSSASNDL
jgi:hypothetical protein